MEKTIIELEGFAGAGNPGGNLMINLYKYGIAEIPVNDYETWWKIYGHLVKITIEVLD